MDLGLSTLVHSGFIQETYPKKKRKKKKNFYDSEVQKTPKSEEASKLVATPIIN